MKKMKSLFKAVFNRKAMTKTLSMLLSLVMIFYVIPTVVYAEAADAIKSIGSPDGSDNGSSSAEAADDVNIYSYEGAVYEVEHLREESAKHFHLEDGSYVAAQYDYPVHYADELGNWQDIENSLAEDASGFFANNTARIKFVKKINGNSELFELKDGSTKLTFSLLGANKGTQGYVTNGADAEEDTALQKMMNLEKLSSSIIYRDILPGVDLEYIADSLNVKENIIVKEKADSYVYTFEMKLNGLTAFLNESGDIIIINEKTGERQYTIPAPTVFDANGVGPSGSEAYYTLAGSNKKYTLTVTVSSEWMNSDERAFPVTVDPAVYTADSNVQDTYITEAAPDTSYGSSTDLAVHTGMYAYWKTTELPELPASAYISSATLTTHSNSANNSYVAMYEVLTDWDENLTWTQFAEDLDNKGYFLEGTIDYNKHKRAGFYNWNLTSLVKEWYADADTNFGVAFGYYPGYTYTSAIAFQSSEISNSIYRPRLSIAYQDMKGLEDYWSYSSHSAGIAGAGSVNLANGNLVLAIPTLSTTDSLMPYTPTLIYDSTIAGKEYKNTTASPNAQTSYGVTYMPLGFKLNICETVIAKVETNNGQTALNYYVYADADGTEHYFYESVTGDFYVDEDGLGKKLTVNSDGTLSMTDDSKITRTFSPVSYAFPDNVLYGWTLTKITDSVGNSVIFTLDSDYRPTKVSIKPNGSSQIDFLELTYYSSGKLRLIYNPTSKDAVVFRYSTYYNDTTYSSQGKYLKRIDYVHGNESLTIGNLNVFSLAPANMSNITIDHIALYEYDSVGHITKAKDNTADQYLNYLWAGNQVLMLTQYGEGHLGNAIAFYNEIGYTEVRDPGNDESTNTDDDIVTRYVFDKYGRTVSVYSAAKNGDAIYGATVGQYSEDEATKNSLSQKTVIGGSAANYLINGDFANGFTGWEHNEFVTLMPRYDSLERKYAGFYPSPDETGVLTQYVILDEGDYTFSIGDYISGDDKYCEAKVIIKSVNGTAVSIEENLPINATKSVDNAFYSTTFKVTSASERIKISIEFTVYPEVDTEWTSPSLYLTDVMLENNVTASRFNLVEYGAFDSSSTNSSGARVPLSNYWSTSSRLSTVSEDTIFGRSINVSSDIEVAHYVKQRIFTASDSVISQSKNNASGEFIISGFGKSDSAISSANAAFRLRVDVIYYQGANKEDVVISYYYDFLPYLTGWQFTGGSFSLEYTPADTDTNSYHCVKAIDVYCEYANQVWGTAQFDNIYVYEVKDRDVEEYTYYESGNEAGLLKIAKTGSLKQYYEYDSNRNITRVADNRGNATDYYYTSNGLVERVISYNFSTSSGTDYPINAANPDSGMSKSNVVDTTYYYDSYGLIGREVTSPLNSDMSYISDSSYIFREYTYCTDEGSKIFGALLFETDDVNLNVRYFYDEADGKLLASINTAEKNGLCYQYDDKDRLIGIRPATYSSSVYSAVTNAESVTYTYNSNNYLSTISTDSTTYTFSYDGYGNTTSIKAGDNTLTKYEYMGKNGKLKKVIYGSDIEDPLYIEEYVYNDLEMLSEIWYTERGGVKTLAYTYEYTKSGLIYKFTDHISECGTIYKYDTSNRVSEIISFGLDNYYNDVDVKYFYNDEDRIQFINYTIETENGSYYNNSYTWSNEYVYNSDGTLSYVESTDGYDWYTEEYYYDYYSRIIDKYTFHYSLYENVTYTYLDYYDNTSRLVSTYTSYISGNGTKTYTYTYDKNNNITKIVYSTGEEIRYVYDDIGQLIREDNGLLNKTIVYSYDNACNITSKVTYALTAEGVTPSGPLSTNTYGYSSGQWGDLLTSYNGNPITYDEIGNPESYTTGEPYQFIWTGKTLTGVNIVFDEYSFTYNDEGIRTSKTKNGTITTKYYLLGSQILAEETNGNVIMYLYDSDGLPMGMRYIPSSGSESRYAFERNILGDVIAVYDDSAALKLVSYVYDAYGNATVTYHNGGENTPAASNPFRYRGYYYDSDIGLYYLNSRYYDSVTGRFISADAQISGVGGDILGYNLFAYCFNNPVNMSDSTGSWPKWIETAANWVNNNVFQPVASFAEESIEYLTPPSKEDHYNRNQNNIQFPKEYDPTFFKGWDNGVSAYCHQFSAPNRDNVKYVSPDGKYEVIYDVKNKLVEDPRDVGTYNFVSPKEDPIGHFIKDVIPWIQHGNSPNDSTEWWQRALSFIAIYV